MFDQHDLLEVRSVKRHYDVGGGRKVLAVDDVSLTLRQGETLSLVGESGCGKSTLSRLMLRLEDPDEGDIVLDGEDVTHLQGDALRQKRRDIQMIFQDPYTCLNPRMTAGEIIGEPLDNFKVGTRDSRSRRVIELLQRVGLREDYTNRYPHELSGGQRQRLGIARALALEPKILLADEPVSALDVSIRAQVINLLMDLQRAFNLSILLVSHDIDIVSHISDRIAVMYLGRIIEIGEADDVLNNPRHPYTRALLDAVPVSHPRERRGRSLVKGVHLHRQSRSADPHHNAGEEENQGIEPERVFLGGCEGHVRTFLMEPNRKCDSSRIRERIDPSAISSCKGSAENSQEGQ